MGSLLTHKGTAVQAGEAYSTPPQEAGLPAQEKVTQGGTQGQSSEGQTARGRVPVPQLLVFTNSVENTSLSIWFQKDLFALEKKKKKKVN